MRKEKRLSRADALEVLRMARGFIEARQEDFICIAIYEALNRKHIKRRWRSAIDLIPELDRYRPVGKRPLMAWWPIEERQTRLDILGDLIDMYEKMEPYTFMEIIGDKINKFLINLKIKLCTSTSSK